MVALGDMGDSNFFILQSSKMSLLETCIHILGLIRFYMYAVEGDSNGCTSMSGLSTKNFLPITHRDYG